MNEVQTTKKLLAIMAVIFVTAALLSLPYQNQVANAAPPAKKYQVYVTLTGVPDNAGDLHLTVIPNRDLALSADTTVSSPIDLQTLKFVITMPSGNNVQSLFVIGEQVANPDINGTDFHTFTGKGSAPIRVDFAYPT